MSKHTPGPWEATTMTGRAMVYAHGFSIAHCGVSDNPFAQANARLIAAAPELLDAARIVEEALRKGEPIHDEKNSVYGDLLRTAIRKATGE